MKYYCETTACLNRSDEYDLVQRKIEEKGFIKTSEPEDADIIMLYTCGSTAAFIKRSVNRAFELSEKYNKQMIICGCSTVTSSASYKDTDFICCTPTDFTELEKYLDSSINQEELRKAEFTDDPIFDQKAIVVQKGCVRKCSYCGIWRAVGTLFSKELDSIVDEVTDLAGQGVYNITLTGDSIADYGVDIGTNIVELLDKLSAVDKRISFNICDFHPRMFIKYMDDMLRLAKNGKIKNFGIPIQSGSPEILKAMKREFNMEKFREGIKELQKYGIYFWTDIIIGFPGETDEDFEQTLNILKKLDFAKVSVNVYTDLEGSISSGMPNKVSRKDIMKRYIAIKDNNIRGVDNDFLDYQISKVVYDR